MSAQALLHILSHSIKNASMPCLASKARHISFEACRFVVYAVNTTLMQLSFLSRKVS